MAQAAAEQAVFHKQSSNTALHRFAGFIGTLALREWQNVPRPARALGINASGEATRGREMPTDLPPMEGTGFLDVMGSDFPARPYTGPEGAWLTEDDLQQYAAEFAHSGFFGPVSYYRNLDANFEVVKDLGPERLAMPSYFITGELDLVNLMDPQGIERMQTLLPDFRGYSVIPGAGHWVQQESPAAFNEALLAHLRSI